jgi:hypothetical protein
MSGRSVISAIAIPSLQVNPAIALGETLGTITIGYAQGIAEFVTLLLWF